MKLDIVIKTLNEEKNIEKCIQSCIPVTKKYNGDIYLIDSLSNDKTIEIAKKYPIKIYQIKNKKYRSCGSQVTFQNIYVKNRIIYYT